MFERFQVFPGAELRNYTTLKLGGPADWLVMPRSAEEIPEILREAKEQQLPVTVIGHGSNLLVLDGGIRGLVIRMGRGMNDCGVDGHTLRASAGACCGEHFLGKSRVLGATPGTSRLLPEAAQAREAGPARLLGWGGGFRSTAARGASGWSLGAEGSRGGPCLGCKDDSSFTTVAHALMGTPQPSSLWLWVHSGRPPWACTGVSSRAAL